MHAQMCSSTSDFATMPVLPAPPATACAPCADSETTANTAFSRRRKKLKQTQPTATMQTTASAQQPLTSQTQLTHGKRKAISQQMSPPERRSTRQRFCPRVFDPSDSSAIDGYIQKRGISPDMQSSLPFETG